MAKPEHQKRQGKTPKPQPTVDVILLSAARITQLNTRLQLWILKHRLNLSKIVLTCSVQASMRIVLNSFIIQTE